MAYTKDYAVERGSDVEISYVIDEAITDWALAFVVSASKGGAAVASSTTGSGITVTDGPGGLCTVTLTSAQLTLTAGVYYYVLRRTDAGSRAVLAKGEFVIDAHSAV